MFRSNGGGGYACGTYLVASGCDLTLLGSIGDTCSGVTYAGMEGGTRLYAGDTDLTDNNWRDAETSCFALGIEWTLPTSAEGGVMHTSRTALGLATSGSYWMSTQLGLSAQTIAIGSTFPIGGFVLITNVHRVRCVRRD